MIEALQRCRGRTCAARNPRIAARLPYTCGPGMPGPYKAAVLLRRNNGTRQGRDESPLQMDKKMPLIRA